MRTACKVSWMNSVSSKKVSTCAEGESNPQLFLGREPCYHYTGLCLKSARNLSRKREVADVSVGIRRTNCSESEGMKMYIRKLVNTACASCVSEENYNILLLFLRTFHPKTSYLPKVVVAIAPGRLRPKDNNFPDFLPSHNEFYCGLCVRII